MQQPRAVTAGSKPSGSRAHWLALAAAVVLLVLVYAVVDLTPRVDQHFFFSSDDPQLQESNTIDRRFPSGSQLILSVSSSDISSERYLDKLRQLTGRIAAIRSVTGVRSLADGPKDFGDAQASPFWSRLLIAENHRSSNVIVLTRETRRNDSFRRWNASFTNSIATIFESGLQAPRTWWR